MKRKITYKQLNEITLGLSITKNELLRLGLMEIYHAIDSATKSVGWEMAKVIDGTHPLLELDEEDIQKSS